MEYHLVEMKASDWPMVSQIYWEGISTKIATFQNTLPSWEEWDKGHVATCRWVAKSGDTVMGWAALSPVSGRCVYSGVAEVSIYIGEKYQGLGIGKALLEKLIDDSEAHGYWMLQSGIIKENSASLKLHEKCGFRTVGYREKLGQMDNGNWHDIILVERRSQKIGSM